MWRFSGASPARLVLGCSDTVDRWRRGRSEAVGVEVGGNGEGAATLGGVAVSSLWGYEQGFGIAQEDFLDGKNRGIKELVGVENEPIAVALFPSTVFLGVVKLEKLIGGLAA